MSITAEAEQSAREKTDAELIAGLGERPPGEAVSDWAFDIVNDPERGRWIAALGSEAIGELTYRFVGGRIVLIKTWVNHAYRGQGVATELIARVLDEIRETGRRITIICSVVGKFIARNPGYADLIDERHPGVGAYPAGTSGDEQLTAFEGDIGS